MFGGRRGWDGVGNRRYGIARVGRKSKKKKKKGKWRDGLGETQNGGRKGRGARKGRGGVHRWEVARTAKNGGEIECGGGKKGEMKGLAASARGWAERDRAEKRWGSAATHRLRSRN